MEQVVLLDESGHANGIADKATVHHQNTPLHLAFSCYVFNERNELLLTQRALTKPTWPGVWTNSCCGHPAPGESITAAVRRRLRNELGLTLDHVNLVLPSFRYRAVMDNGIVENEICPVFRTHTEHSPQPDPAEVHSLRWIEWHEFVKTIDTGTFEISPWCQQQVDQLRTLGSDPRRWPLANEALLPAVARNTTSAAPDSY